MLDSLATCIKIGERVPGCAVATEQNGCIKKILFQNVRARLQADLMGQHACNAAARFQEVHRQFAC